jgi:hypothetical protein
LLAALLGKEPSGLSATTIARLKEVWIDEHKQWSERDLSAKSYVYVWADGVYLQASQRKISPMPTDPKAEKRPADVLGKRRFKPSH